MSEQGRHSWVTHDAHVESVKDTVHRGEGRTSSRRFGTRTAGDPSRCRFRVGIQMMLFD